LCEGNSGSEPTIKVDRVVRPINNFIPPVGQPPPPYYIYMGLLLSYTPPSENPNDIIGIPPP